MNQNESYTRRETATYRMVTGQSSNFPQGDGTIDTDTFPAAGSVPVARTFTGTISSNGTKVVGSGTAFITEGIKVGDYIYVAAQNAVRRIKAIIHDTMLDLDQGFPSNISGVAVLVCESQIYKRILWENTGTAAASIQETIISVGAKGFNEGTPVAYDASASNAQLEFTCTL